MNAPTSIADLRGKELTQPRKTMADIIKLPKPKQLPAMLDSFHSEIVKALPKHLNADRISRVALTAFRRTPKLALCEPASVFAAIIQSAQLGLEIDTLGRAFLVPYKKECQFIPGWKGLVELVHRSKQASVWTGAVFEGDFFEYSLGDSPYIKHRPSGETDEPNAITRFYAVGRPAGSEWPVIEVWTSARVLKHRNRYNKVGDSHYSHGNWEMYGRKVVLLQVLKYLPMSPELANALELDNAAEAGRQGLTPDDVIEGTWQPVPHEDDDGGGKGEAEQPTAAAGQAEQAQPEKAQETKAPATARGKKAPAASQFDLD